MDKYKILVVEDERIVGEDIKNSLIRIGYDVLDVISSSEKALQFIDKNPPDLVLMDIVLMGSVAQRVVQITNDPIFMMPILVQTGMEDSEDQITPCAEIS